MKKILIYVLSCALGSLVFSSVALADSATSTASYCLNSRQSVVSVSIQVAQPKIVAGATIPLAIELTNNENYPLSGGTIMLRLVGSNFSSKALSGAAGSIFIREFPVTNISLTSHGSYTLNTTLAISENLPAGTYTLDALYVPSDSFNLQNPDLTLSQGSGVNEAKIPVSISSSSTQPIVYFSSKSSTSVSGSASSLIPVSVNLVNPSSVAVSVPVIWKVYYFDAINQKNLLDSFVQMVNIPADGSKNISYSVKNTNHAFYTVLVQGTLNNMDAFAAVSVSRPKSEPIITALGIDPSIAANSIRVFACVDNVLSFQNKVAPTISFSVVDENSVSLTQGQLTLATTTMSAFTTDFDPGMANTLTLSADIFSPSGGILDQKQVSFSCDQFRSDCATAKNQTASSGGNNSLYEGIAELVIGIIVIIFFVELIKKGKKRDMISQNSQNNI